MSRWLTTLLTLMVISGFAEGSQTAELRLHFSHLGVEDGLSSGAVADVLQDSNGFIWLATQDGVNRYDGSRIRVFRHRAEDEQSLVSSNNHVLLEDPNGYLWIGSRDRGLTRLDPRTEEVVRYGASDGLQSLAITALASVDDDLWVGTRGGLHHISLQSGELTAIPIPGAQTVNTVAVDAAGSVWVGTDRAGVIRRDSNGETHRVVGADRITSPVTEILFDDAEGDVWIGTEGSGLFRANFLRQTVTQLNKRMGLADDHVSDLLLTRSQLWIATWGGGVQRLNTKTRDLETLVVSPGNPWALNHHTISALFEDRSGVLWVGTWGRGVNLHHRYGPRFQTYRHAIDQADSLSESPVNFVYPRGKHELLVGTWGSGLDVVNRREGSVAHYPVSRTDPTAPHNGRMYAILEVGDDLFWIGTDDGISVLDARTMRFQALRLPNGERPLLQGTRVRTLLRDRHGSIWLGTESRGLHRVDAASGRIRPFQHEFGDPASLSHNRVNALFEDATGGLWVGTSGGVNYMGPGAENFKHYRAGPATRGGLSSDSILSFYQDEEGLVWIGTEYGLNRLDPETGDVEHYTSAGTLPNDVINAILPDHEGRLWLGTNRGLARFDRQSGHSNNYHRRDGLQAEQFNAGAAHRDSGGEIFFGGTEGFTTLEPGSILDNPVAPIPQIVDVEVFNRSSAQGFVRPQSLARRQPYTVDQVRLVWRDLMVQFHFAALHYAAPSTNRIAYRLIGLDDSWIVNDGTRPIATFSNLPPGEYKLELRAANSDGVWSKDPRELRVLVDPPPWRTPWAYLGYACSVMLVVLIGVWFFRRKLDKERAVNEQLRKADERLSQANATLEAQVRGRTQALRQANRALEDLSLTDALTGVRNRRFFTERVVPEIDQLMMERRQGSAREDDQIDIVCFMIDIDKFKRLNDTYGHATGDDIITEFAILLEEQFRQSDHVIRWGGEEFLVIARLKRKINANRVAERMRAAVETHEFCTDRGALQLTCSIGYARYPFIPQQPEHLTIFEVIELADQCLYRAKESGRNRWCGAAPRPDIDLESIKLALSSGDAPVLESDSLIVDLYSEGAANQWTTGRYRTVRESDVTDAVQQTAKPEVVVEGHDAE